MTDEIRTLEKAIRDRTDSGQRQCLCAAIACPNAGTAESQLLRECFGRVFFDVLQLGLLNSPTGCQKAALPFTAMDLTISDLKQSIEAKCEDTIPFKILFAYEIEEVDLPRTEIEASDMTYTSVDFYELQSDKLSLLSRFDPRSEIIRRARKGDCRLRQ
jgi:hypothetical protein